MLDLVLLFFHLCEDRFGRSKLSGESLEGDAGAVVEGLEVSWFKVAALFLPLLVVDGASFQETFRGICIQDGEGCD